MKSIILVAFALVAVAVAAPAEPDVTIVKSSFDMQPDGSYQFGYEGSDGNQRNEVGEVKEAFDEDNKPHNVVVMRGSYSYIDPEGKVQLITYFADENGYQAEGDSIPKAPVARR